MQAQTLGDLQPALDTIFNISIFGILGFPPAMPLEESIWHFALAAAVAPPDLRLCNPNSRAGNPKHNNFLLKRSLKQL